MRLLQGHHHRVAILVSNITNSSLTMAILVSNATNSNLIVVILDSTTHSKCFASLCCFFLMSFTEERMSSIRVCHYLHWFPHRILPLYLAEGPPPMPPSQVQKYGPHFQGQNNQDAQPWFQYSLCNGKKKGLFVRLTYEQLFNTQWPSRCRSVSIMLDKMVNLRVVLTMYTTSKPSWLVGPKRERT